MVGLSRLFGKRKRGGKAPKTKDSYHGIEPPSPKGNWEAKGLVHSNCSKDSVPPYLAKGLNKIDGSELAPIGPALPFNVGPGQTIELRAYGTPGTSFSWSPASGALLRPEGAAQVIEVPVSSGLANRNCSKGSVSPSLLEGLNKIDGFELVPIGPALPFNVGPGQTIELRAYGTPGTSFSWSPASGASLLHEGAAQVVELPVPSGEQGFLAPEWSQVNAGIDRGIGEASTASTSEVSEKPPSEAGVSEQDHSIMPSPRSGFASREPGSESDSAFESGGGGGGHRLDRHTLRRSHSAGEAELPWNRRSRSLGEEDGEPSRHGSANESETGSVIDSEIEPQRGHTVDVESSSLSPSDKLSKSESETEPATSSTQPPSSQLNSEPVEQSATPTSSEPERNVKKRTFAITKADPFKIKPEINTVEPGTKGGTKSHKKERNKRRSNKDNVTRGTPNPQRKLAHQNKEDVPNEGADIATTDSFKTSPKNQEEGSKAVGSNRAVSSGVERAIQVEPMYQSVPMYRGLENQPWGQFPLGPTERSGVKEFSFRTGIGLPQTNKFTDPVAKRLATQFLHQRRNAVYFFPGRGSNSPEEVRANFLLAREELFDSVNRSALDSGRIQDYARLLDWFEVELNFLEDRDRSNRLKGGHETGIPGAQKVSGSASLLSLTEGDEKAVRQAAERSSLEFKERLRLQAPPDTILPSFDESATRVLAYCKSEWKDNAINFRTLDVLLGGFLESLKRSEEVFRDKKRQGAEGASLGIRENKQIKLLLGDERKLKDVGNELRRRLLEPGLDSGTKFIYERALKRLELANLPSRAIQLLHESRKGGDEELAKLLMRTFNAYL